MPLSDRLFLALQLAPEVRADLVTATRPLRSTLVDEISWEPQSHWHITLAFLGNRDRKDREQICRTAAAAALTAEAANLRIAGTGRFNTALWVGVAGGSWLRRMAEGLTHRSGLDVQERSFHAHVTVARSTSASAGQAFHADLGNYLGPTWFPRNLTLMESSMGGTPRYRLLQQWKLLREPQI